MTYPGGLTLAANAPQSYGDDGADFVTNLGNVTHPGYVNSVQIIPGWTMSGANTNSRTYNLYNRGPAGAGATLIATLALTSGVNLTKFVATALTLQTGATAVNVGDIIEWESLHVGSGLPDPGGRIIVKQSMGY